VLVRRVKRRILSEGEEGNTVMASMEMLSTAREMTASGCCSKMLEALDFALQHGHKNLSSWRN
jgi:hypothetical protein